MNSISGLGALLGAIYMTNVKPRWNLLKMIVLASILLSVCLICFSYTKIVWLALLILMIGEAGMLVQIASTNTYVQTNVEERMRGRVVSYYVMAFQGMQPIGSLLIGWMAHVTSAPLAVLCEGLSGVTVAVLFIPALRR